MSPAFSSTRQAAAFALLLLALLLLPALMGKSVLPPREQVYSSVPWEVGAFPYMHDQIFEEKGDIDVAFMGSSRIWWAIDTPWVQEQLSAKLGRPAVVRSLCWNWAGFDALYFTMKDLLEHRNVRVIVFNDCSSGTGNNAHTAAPYWFRLGDNAEDIVGLPLNSRVSFYSSAILGMPRNLLGMVRTNLPAVPMEELTWTWRPTGFTNLPNLSNPSARLGAAGLYTKTGRTFPAYVPQNGAGPEDVRLYSEATKGDFQFSENSLAEMQADFLRKIAALAKAHHVKLVYLHLPLAADRTAAKLEEPAYWPDFLGGELAMMGVPPARFFAGTPEDSYPGLFWNFDHLNVDGQEYFTKLITPDLLRIYEDQTKP